ncbi:protein stum homolog [Penaeus japonicus]|uniref:protein stum homolog n=1 Tax=Penaeus japonicus TaxID=27405 RepID=UPI001C70C37F|nr:protein stum homolog [Penaeus japonicus]
MSQYSRSEENGEKKKERAGSKKDWLAAGGIGIEKRRRSSAASYRIENNKVLIENEDGEVQEFEILASKEKHGTLRKAVPTLPVSLAICCLVLNMVPGLGTLVSGLAVLCGYPTEHSSKGAGVFYNLLVALLQLILAPIIVGWIWSIQRGIILVQESMNQKIEQRERRMSQDVTA